MIAWDKDDIVPVVRLHGIPVLAGVVVALGGGALALLAGPSRLLVLHGVFVLAGGVIGLLTPRGNKDHRGTNGMALLVVSWLAYILLSGILFGKTPLLSQWLFALVINNIINGFAIILGLWLGSYAQPHVDFNGITWLRHLENQAGDPGATWQNAHLPGSRKDSVSTRQDVNKY